MKMRGNKRAVATRLRLKQGSQSSDHTLKLPPPPLYLFPRFLRCPRHILQLGSGCAGCLFRFCCGFRRHIGLVASLVTFSVHLSQSFTELSQLGFVLGQGQVAGGCVVLRFEELGLEAGRGLGSAFQLRGEGEPLLLGRRDKLIGIYARTGTRDGREESRLSYNMGGWHKQRILMTIKKKNLNRSPA